MRLRSIVYLFTDKLLEPNRYRAPTASINSLRVDMLTCLVTFVRSCRPIQQVARYVRLGAKLTR